MKACWGYGHKVHTMSLSAVGGAGHLWSVWDKKFGKELTKQLYIMWKKMDTDACHISYKARCKIRQNIV